MKIRSYFSLKFSSLITKYEDVVIIAVAVAIGMAAGVGNIIFRTLIHFLQKNLYSVESEVMLYNLQDTAKWKLILIPALGGLAVGLITTLFKSNVHSVADVIKSISLHRTLSPVTAVLKTITSAITLGTGGSAGREGPIVMIGASLGSAVGQFFKFSHTRISSATACGAAGGIAATFNAPMGGAMFAAEVLLGKYGVRTFSPLIISAVTATVISRAYFGDEITIQSPDYVLKSAAELPLYAIMGIFIALISVFFIRFFYKVSDAFAFLPLPKWLKPAIGGLLMGILGAFCINIMGVGYGTIIEILQNKIPWYILIVFVFLKIVATSLTLGSGGSGGQLVPSLFIGAAAGGFFGGLMQYIFPSIAGNPETYALVGMGAMLAAVIRAPITSILILFEITQSYHIVLPVMITCIIANMISASIEKDSIFTWTLTRAGFNINHGIDKSILESVKVKDIMLTDIIAFNDNTSILDIKKSIEKKPHAYFPVVNDEGYLTGVISLNDLKEEIFSGKNLETTLAKDFGARRNIITVSPEETLEQAMRDFGIKEVGDLPVVEIEEKGMKLVGLLRRSDIIIAYNKKVVDFEPDK
ncbi:chloride channel protein [Mucispirillum schaedleri]|uniref:Voltage-gated ClC-type chloride channel ClcB n=1 Tax=Mucispirillum schaedleri ASF457 TaxID=1379858 RepID=V2QAF7_9BACT|nr:chloride channel protein [Mucispirillum schaedleri]MCX4360168.1 chloride channel protein [Mucispirillum schaedleri]USF24661.1 Voltage-gated ClC-type chloride channel ClcB [Mucispirillum schaedleri ASF457]SIW07796.1 conserved membrane hypothetical protein [Mucispirillum schaedleri ASF457]